MTPWIQGAGGVLWTNHKYPAYGDTTANLNTNGPNGDASVWNFTPQGGGWGCITLPTLTDRSTSVRTQFMFLRLRSATVNPGVNVSVQLSVGLFLVGSDLRRSAMKLNPLLECGSQFL